MGKQIPTTQEATKDMLEAFVQYMPEALNITNENVLPTAQAQLAADQAVSPAYAAMQTELLRKYGPMMSEIGSRIDRQQQLDQAGTEREIAGGPGRDLVKLSDEFQRFLDPEFYRNRSTVARGQEQLLGAMDPTRLSTAESEEIERALGRRGPRAASAMNTVTDAMTFGSALQDKQSRFSDVLTQAASTLPALRSGITGFEVATRRPLVSNTGLQQFAGGTMGAGGANTFGFGSQFLGQTGQLANTRQAKMKDFWDKLGIAGQFIGDTMPNVSLMG